MSPLEAEVFLKCLATAQTNPMLGAMMKSTFEEQCWQQCFDTLPKDQHGLVQLADIRANFDKFEGIFGLRNNQEAFSLAAKTTGEPKDDVLEIDDFIDLIRKVRANDARAVASVMPMLKSVIPTLNTKLEQLFALIDIDGDGTLSNDEFSRVCGRPALLMLMAQMPGGLPSPKNTPQAEARKPVTWDEFRDFFANQVLSRAFPVWLSSCSCCLVCPVAWCLLLLGASFCPVCVCYGNRVQVTQLAPWYGLLLTSLPECLILVFGELWESGPSYRTSTVAKAGFASVY